MTNGEAAGGRNAFHPRSLTAAVGGRNFRDPGELTAPGPAGHNGDVGAAGGRASG
jgi:hypothetical protein